MREKTIGSIVILGFLVFMQPKYVSAQENFAKKGMFQLSAPKVEVDSLLFIESTAIAVKEGTPGTQVFYQIKEGEVNLLSSTLNISSSTKLRVWAEHPEFQKSDTQEIQVVKISDALTKAEITLNTKPHDSYSGDGAQTLNDLKKGTTSFRGSKNWLGFQEENIEMSIKLPKSTKISKVQLGVLADQGSWIFMPSSIEVYTNGRIIGKMIFPEASKESTSKSTFITADIESGEYGNINLIIKALDAIPNWHPGKGTPAWVFIDEILIEP